jgi:uncharacterized protein (TIGR03083 family)
VTTASRDPSELPAGLRERVLATSLRARRAGRPVPDAPEIPAEEAFSRAADAFYTTLRGLDGGDWTRPALRGLDVQGLVGHLIGVENDVHRCLSGDPDVADAGHVESTQAAAIGQAGLAPARTRAEWREAANRTLDLVRSADPAAKVALHGMRLPVRALLLVRAFELWIHENDIRQAIGWAPSVADASTLRMMADLAARLLPGAAARAGVHEPAEIHLVLTGPGGGTWDVAVGDHQPGPAAVTIVTDTVGFCRLAGNRVTPAQLDPYVTGDAELAADVLAAATKLALD